MKILAIGNSFSEDATRYLSAIARAQDERIDVMNLYYPGCPLDRHYRNMLANKAEYTLIFNGENTGIPITMEQALLSREWDAVTLQQVSRLSFRMDTYYPYITALADYVRRCQPKAKIYLHQTWAYEEGCDRLREVAGYAHASEMLSDIEKCYAEVAEREGFDGIIPSGSMLFALLENGIGSVHRDHFHASRGLGRYALGLLWFRMLTGASVAENRFCALDEPATPEEMAIARRVVDSFDPL